MAYLLSWFHIKNELKIFNGQPFQYESITSGMGFKWCLLCTTKIRSGGGKFPVNYLQKNCLIVVLLKCAWRWHCQNLPMCGYLVITMSNKSFCHELQYLCTWYNYIPKSSCGWAVKGDGFAHHMSQVQDPVGTVHFLPSFQLTRPTTISVS